MGKAEEINSWQFLATNNVTSILLKKLQGALTNLDKA